MRLTPKVYATAWFAALTTALPEQRPNINKAWLNRLRREGKFAWLSRVLSQMREIEDHQLGIHRIHVTVAHELPREFVQQTVKTVLGLEQVVIDVLIDPKIAGGLVIETPNERWNVSLQVQLQELKQRLLA